MSWQHPTENLYTNVQTKVIYYIQTVTVTLLNTSINDDTDNAEVQHGASNRLWMGRHARL